MAAPAHLPSAVGDNLADGQTSESHPVARINGYLPIGDYAAIGDGRTVALVGADGAIDWMCLPELDAPSSFAAILDAERGGRFALCPAIPFTVRRAYAPQTNVLETTFETEQGSVRVTDALTLDSSQGTPWRELVRKVEGIRGEVPMRFSCRPAFEFAQQPADWTSQADVWICRDGRLQVALLGWDVGEITAEESALAGEFTLKPGDDALLVLLASAAPTLPLPSRAAIERRLGDTHHVWRSWVRRHSYEGPWTDAVERSLLALRLLADGRSGAIAAAGTNSLPEALGSNRNYDYRYAWVRDLSFSVDALLSLGMEELAHRSIDWIMRATARTHPRVDPVYSLTAEVIRSQQALELPGYRTTSPVHLGNQAGSQLQLGGAGDLLETLWRAVRQGTILAPEVGERLADVADQMCLLWQNPDAGLWELGSYAQYGTSKISCWVLFDRVLDLVARGQVPARHVERWQRARDAVRNFIETELWSESRQAYLFKAGSEELDCGVLLAARRGYVERGSARLSSTIDAIIEELDAGDGLLYRYSGMQEQENAFLACSFWMVEALAYAGRRSEAVTRMDQLVALSNDVGLLSEEMQPGSHELRGNFPQAITHLSLINAAALLSDLDG